MDIKKYIGKKISIPTADTDQLTISDLSNGWTSIEILAWADGNSNFAALYVEAKDSIIQEVYRERFCWMCPNGKCAEKRITRFPSIKAEKTAETVLKTLLA